MTTRHNLADHLEIVAEVSPIRQLREGGWGFFVTDEHGTVHYATSTRGDGLWIVDEPFIAPTALDRQVSGTAQFDLSGLSASGRRYRVLRRLAAVPVG